MRGHVATCVRVVSSRERERGPRPFLPTVFEKNPRLFRSNSAGRSRRFSFPLMGQWVTSNEVRRRSRRKLETSRGRFAQRLANRVAAASKSLGGPTPGGNVPG